MSVFAILPSGSELLLALVVGLLLFGGKLPEVAKDIGRTFFKLKRSVNDLRRETGIDQTLRDLRREVEQAKPVVDLNAPPYQPWPGDRREKDDDEAQVTAPETDADGVATEEGGDAGDGPRAEGVAEEPDEGPVERSSSPTRPRRPRQED